MKYALLIGLLSVGLFSCTSNKNSDIGGIYYGILPCADCPGINYELELKKDRTYIEKMMYVERDVEPRETKGSFKIEKDTVLVLKGKDENAGMGSFSIKGDSLFMLNNSGKPINSVFSKKYGLSKEKPAGFSLKPEKRDKSIGFKATGNEPFWTLTIDFNNNMHFKSLSGEGFELNLPVPEPVKPQDVEAVSYRAENEEGSLFVTIFRKKCKDSMSGQEFERSVKVQAKTFQMKEIMEFSGCGQYMGDYRLNDIWVLNSIDGKGLNMPKGAKAPNLEFQLKEQKVFGFSGCNRLSGSMRISGKTIKIGQLAVTKMACPNMEFETEFLKAITGKTFKFEIGENQLTLSNKNKTLIFKKVD